MNGKIYLDSLEDHADETLRLAVRLIDAELDRRRMTTAEFRAKIVDLPFAQGPIFTLPPKDYPE